MATAEAHQDLFEDRWSGYDKQSGIIQFSNQLTVRELKQYPLLEDYDDDFLKSISHDISVATWEKGVILFEEGSYLDLAFFITDGKVDIFLQKDRESSAQPIFNQTFLSTTTPSEDPSLNQESTCTRSLKGESAHHLSDQHGF